MYTRDLVGGVDEINENENIGSQNIMKHGAIIKPSTVNGNFIIIDASERMMKKIHLVIIIYQVVSMITSTTPVQVITTITPFNPQKLGKYNNELSWVWIPL